MSAPVLLCQGMSLPISGGPLAEQGAAQSHDSDSDDKEDHVTDAQERAAQLQWNAVVALKQ